VGRRVRLLRQAENRQIAVPAGALGTITSQSPIRPHSNGFRNGSTVRFDGCACCQVAAVMSGFGPGDFEFVEERSPVKAAAKESDNGQ
jgi:hypothetical protein